MVRAATLVPLLPLVLWATLPVPGCSGDSDEPHMGDCTFWVLEPDGSDRWAVGSSQRIRWSANTASPLIIELSRDGGASWEIIANSVDPSVSGITWPVSDGGLPLPQVECRIRVSKTEGTDRSRTCQNFTIQAQRTWYVDLSATPGGDGLAWGTAFQHPQDAMDVAASGDEVWVAGGTYVRRDSGDEVLLTLWEGVQIYGGFAGTESARGDRDWVLHETVLDGEDAVFHVVVALSDNVLDGFVVTGGNADGTSYSNQIGGGFTDRSVRQGSVVANCRFFSNSADRGGAIHTQEDTNLAVTNCVISSNHAQWYGGGIYSYDGSLAITNSVVVDNTADVGGGGICAHVPSMLPVVRNCISWGNAPDEILASGADVEHSNIQGGFTGTGNIDADPLFVDPDGADNIPGNLDDDFRLQAGSPCIDAADGDVAPAFDLDGNARADDPATTPNTGSGTPDFTDMGAYEYQPPQTAPVPRPAGQGWVRTRPPHSILSRSTSGKTSSRYSASFSLVGP